jgi:transposase-like protein
MGRGRRPNGSRLVEALEGSAVAKRRMQLILETLAAQRSVQEASRELGVSPAAFHKMRRRFFQEAVSLLEPKPVGRPRREPSEAERVRRSLEAENRELRIDLEAARIREELAIVLPHVLQPPAKGPSKKGRQRGPGGVVRPVDGPGATPGGSKRPGKRRRAPRTGDGASGNRRPGDGPRGR